MKPQPDADGYIVCESYPAYRYHIRQVPPGESVKPSGGLSGVTVLCGYTLMQGWDVLTPLPKTKEDWSTGERTWTNCKACSDVFHAVKKGAP
jgi:hypothetical protein